LEPKSIQVAETLSNIGILYWNKGNYDKTLENFELCIKFQKEILGSESIKVATTLNNFGVVYKDKGDLKKALENFN
jgi:tetratricopeptide (TPR) repeat protein